jgi:hypothetical protein
MNRAVAQRTTRQRRHPWRFCRSDVCRFTGVMRWAARGAFAGPPPVPQFSWAKGGGNPTQAAEVRLLRRSTPSWE